MTEDEFRRLAATYGGDLARWPTAACGEAAALVRRAPHLEQLLRTELAFDERLRASAPLVAPARVEAAMRAVSGAIVRTASPAVLPAQDRGWQYARLAFLGCALLGFVIGMQSPAKLFNVTSPQDIIAVLTGGEDAALF